jgi:hypothetical protein
MKPRNREVNIFNMSLLDILTGALGAFCFMMLALFPYYTKAQKQGAAASAGNAEQLQQQLEDANKRIEQLEKTFPITVEVTWSEPVDVDLYLWRPATKPQPEPTLDKKLGAWIRGDATTECTRGPCTETWSMRDFARGLDTKIYYILFNMYGNPSSANVSGLYLSPDGTFRLPPVTLTPQKRIVFVGALERTQDDHLVFKSAVPMNDSPPRRTSP